VEQKLEEKLSVKQVEPGAKCRILSFCGGGVRGLLSAGMLNRLHKANPACTSHATFLAGTSTGADIISMMLAGSSTAKIYETYSTRAPKMFDGPKTVATEPAYDIGKLVAAQRLQHLTNPPISSFTSHLLFTSFNVGHLNSPWQPLLFHNFPGSPTGSTPIVDAVVSSSAMPGMYGSHKGNVDGAFINHDPTLSAIAVAVKAGYQLQNISAICFGTGLMPNYIASDTSNWGAQQWMNGDGNPANRLPSLLINGSQSPILNMCMDGTSTSLTQQLCGMMLGDRFAYVNAPLRQIIAENDNSCEALDALKLAAYEADLCQAEAVLSNYWKL